MKLKNTLYGLYVLVPLAGWYSPPVLMAHVAESCEVRTLVIYDEPTQTVLSQARWYSENGRNSHNYSASLTRQRDGAPDETVMAEGTVTTQTSFATHHVNFKTLEFHRITGPAPSEQWPGAYLDPGAKKGFNAAVRLFRTGDTWLTGFQGRPRMLCHPQR